MIDKAKGKKVLVFGDLMIDEYIEGSVTRISPESAVPVVEQKKKRQAPGGAATVALCLKEMGLEVSIYGVVGRDDNGGFLCRSLLESGVSIDGIEVLEYPHPTTTKTRIIGSGVPRVRVDVERMHEEVRPRLVGVDRVDAVIVSDYGKGAVTQGSMGEVWEFARRNNIPVFVDPKNPDWTVYGSGIDCFFPNEKEAREAFRGPLSMCLAHWLRVEYRAKAVCITRGDTGVTVSVDQKQCEWPAEKVETMDSTGAGAVFCAAYVSAHLGGASPSGAAKFANTLAGLSLGKSGFRFESLRKVLSDGEVKA